MAHAAVATEPPSRKTSKAGDRRERLLAAGLGLFAERAFNDVAAADIAERAGVAHGLMFHYFGSKLGLYVAVLEQAALEERTRVAANTTPDNARWLKNEVDIFLQGVSEGAMLFATLIHGAPGAESSVQKLVSREREEAARRILTRLNPTGSTALLTTATVSWVAYANEMGAQWAESGRVIQRSRLRAVLIDALNNTLLSVSEHDPAAEFDPQTFLRP